MLLCFQQKYVLHITMMKMQRNVLKRVPELKKTNLVGFFGESVGRDMVKRTTVAIDEQIGAR